MATKRLLIVDDAPFLRSVVREIAQDTGWNEIHEAASAEQAIHLFERLTPDLVVLDLRLPGSSGLELLDHFRRINPAARTIALGSLNQKETAKDAIRLGALTVVTKPFAPEHFRAVLGHFA